MLYKMIDLFAGCGGLEDGFMQSGKYEDVAAVEWLQPQVKTLINQLKTKWNITDADERVMCFDVQKEEELFHGWSDESVSPSREILPNGKESRYKTGPYGKGKGLDYFVDKVGGRDIIIGGPPCQAYSVAGRVRDENGKEYNLHETIDILMKQQDTINKQQAEIERLQKIIDLTQYQLKVQDRILKEVGE